MLAAAFEQCTLGNLWQYEEANSDTNEAQGYDLHFVHALTSIRLSKFPALPAADTVYMPRLCFRS